MSSIFGGLKSKTSKYLDELKAKREQDKREQEEYQTLKRKEEQKIFANDLRNQAIEAQKEKAIHIIDSDVPLGKKLHAVNELYKDHSKPKSSNALQEISDRAYINRYRRDKRIEKNNFVKELVNADKLRRQNQILERKSNIKLRQQEREVKNEVRKLLNEGRLKR